MKLFQLVYASRSAIKVTPEIVQDILSSCEANNNILKISGILNYRNGRFMQLLEGGETDVRKLFDSIARDARHTDIQVLYEGHGAANRMSLWAMGFSSGELAQNAFASKSFYLNLEEAAALCKDLPDEIGHHFLAFIGNETAH